ncbi:hypothetical protein [Enterococcus saigonensis]
MIKYIFKVPIKRMPLKQKLQGTPKGKEITATDKNTTVSSIA